MVLPVRAGRLFHGLEIQTHEDTVDSQGTPLRAWTTIKCVYGFVQDVSGMKPEIADKLDPRTTHLIEMRFVPNIDPTVRYKFKGLFLYFIKLLNELQRDTKMFVEAQQRTVQGDDN